MDLGNNRQKPTIVFTKKWWQYRASNNPRIKLPSKRVIILFILVVVLIVAVVVGSKAGYKAYKQYKLPTSTKAANATNDMNQAIKAGNKTQALADAKLALSYDPNNIDSMLAVAYLAKSQDPSQAPQYFNQAFNAFKAQNNPDSKDANAITCWAAAGLAEEAGQTTQAVQYYKDVIQRANLSDAYQKSLVQQSQAALKRLQS
jgi:tetratricopeptide (TPR) repeat protein